MQYGRSDEVTWDMSGDRAVVLDAAGAVLITLNPVGSLLWQMLDSPRAAADLVDALADRYPEVPLAQLREDVELFLEELMAEGLLVVPVEPG